MVSLVQKISLLREVARVQPPVENLSVGSELLDTDNQFVASVQLVESSVSSTLIASLVLDNTAALWLDQVETLVLAVVPCSIGLAIGFEYLAAYSYGSKAVRVVERLVENFAQGFVHNFGLMIRMVNHMHLKPNIDDSVDGVFVLVIFFSFHTVWNNSVILGENRSNNMNHWWIPVELSDVGDGQVFFQSCSSYYSHSGYHCCSLDVLSSFLDSDSDFGIAVCSSVLVPLRIWRRWLPFLQFLGLVAV